MKKYKPWTAEETEILTNVYPEGGPAAAMAALPERGQISIRNKAVNMGIRHIGWSSKRDAELKRLWLKKSIQELSGSFGVSEESVKWRAELFELHILPAGYELIDFFGTRMGIRSRTAKNILQRHGVPIKRISVRRRPGYVDVVHSSMAERAVRNERESEFVETAAKKRGIHPGILRDMLMRLGAKRPHRGMRWRMSSDMIDIAHRECHNMETVTQSAAAAGIPLETMTSWLETAGVIPRSRKRYRVPRWVANYVSKCAKELIESLRREMAIRAENFRNKTA